VPSIAALLMMDMSKLHVTEREAPAPLNALGALGELREGLSYALRTPAALLIVILMAFLGRSATTSSLCCRLSQDMRWTEGRRS